MVECIFCSASFVRKYCLKRHYTTCTLSNMDTADKMQEFQEKYTIQKQDQTINGNINADNVVNGNLNIINLNVTVNPITKLDTNYIEPSKMKELVENYSYLKLNYLLSDYIKEILHHKDHPENHSVKYIKVKPPTFANTINKESGQTTNVIKNLKDSCELLSDPVLKKLKTKLRECKKEYQNDDDFQDMYEDTVRDLYKELNKDSVKKALSNVLQTNILTDINMKVNVHESE